MALNSTPSRSMSLGRHHSSMFPVTPMQQGDIKKDRGADRSKFTGFSCHFIEHRPGRVLWKLEQQLCKHGPIGEEGQRVTQNNPVIGYE